MNTQELAQRISERKKKEDEGRHSIRSQTSVDETKDRKPPLTERDERKVL